MNKLDLLTCAAAGVAAALFSIGYVMRVFTGAEFAAAMIGIGVVALAVINTQGE